MLGRIQIIALLVGLILLPSVVGARSDIEGGRIKAQAAAVRLAEVLTPWDKSNLGLGAGSARNITLGRPMAAFTITRPDLTQTDPQSVGTVIRETGTVFWPVRVADNVRAGVWVRRIDDTWQAIGVGEKEMAKSLARARSAVSAALISRGLYDPYELRLLILDWAASRFVAVLIRDQVLLWPLPSAAKLLRLGEGFYPYPEIKPMLSGRSAE